MIGRIKHIVTNYLIRHLLKSITVEDVLHKEGKHWFVNGHKIDDGRLADLKEEADSLLNSEIWKMMSNEIKWRSNLQMFEKATVSDDMLYGKAMLFNWELATKFLQQVRTLD